MKISLPVDTCYALPGTRKIFLQERKIKSMSVIIILLIASISVAALFLVAFLWGLSLASLKMTTHPPPVFFLMTNLLHLPKQYNSKNNPAYASRKVLL